MKSRTTESFRKRQRALPAPIRRRADRAYRVWKTNPNHPSLFFKKIFEQREIYSVRIGLDYRAVGAKEVDVIVWFWIGSHAGYDALIKKLR